MEAGSVEEQLLQILRSGPLTMYQLARRLGLSYGGAQWYVQKLERTGLVRSYKLAGRRYVALSSVDLAKVVTIGDLLAEVEDVLRAAGIKKEMSLADAVRIAKGRAGALLSLLTSFFLNL